MLTLAASCTTVQTNSPLPPTPAKFEAKIPKETVADNNNGNPLIKDATIIYLKKDGAIFLKGEKIGTIDETGGLEKILTKIFEEKKKANNQDATAVFIKSERSVKYGDVTKLIEKLKAFRAVPIGLQIDDLEQD